MNEIQSYVTQIGQEKTHYGERERERWNQGSMNASAPLSVLQKSSSDQSAKNISAHNESLGNGRNHL